MPPLKGGLTQQAYHPNIKAAFTLIELVLVVVIIGVLASMAVPEYQKAVEMARVAKAIGDIHAIALELSSLDSLPASLAAVDRSAYNDPWNRPYVYLRLESPKTNGTARKDHFLVPLNTDFDLYSKGRDGASAAALTAKASADDIIRANNGGFIGLAERY